ncbi:MAG TPA: ABC transporter permease, partial [Acidobacteriaceae bacterium]|nr:ABC transporter permease [Acidobacteriaceae bacterium]
FHVERHAEDLMRRGMPREEAMRRAKAELGSLAAARENTRQAWGTRWFDEVRGDLRFAFRLLAKSPGFTLIAVGSLALGIGANTAIFSVVNAVLLRPLPFPHPEELVVVTEASTQQGGIDTGLSYSDFEAWRQQSRSLGDIAGFQFHDLTLTGKGDPVALDTVVTTPNLFSLLEVNPVAGRTFSAEDGVRGAAPVAVVSEKLWRSRWGGDPGMVGQTITLDQRPFTVVGVMPENFHFPLGAANEDVWIPLAQDPLFGPWMNRTGGHWLRVVGRLRPGASLQAARTEMVNLAVRRAKEDPANNAGFTAHLTPLQQIAVSGVKSPLLIVLCAVGLVLLIACANIANLLLARATARAKEMAVRVALGADRRRIARQLLIECAVLGILGGGFGVGLASAGVWGLRGLLLTRLPQIHAIRVDGWVLGFALGLSLAASVIFGLAPVFFATRSDPQKDLAEGARAGEARGSQRARSALAVAQVALAMMLLVGAGLLMRSFVQLTSVNPGFAAKDVIKADIQLPRFQYSTPQQWTAFSDELLRRLHAQPGLQQSAIVVPLPVLDGFVNLGFKIDGAPPLPPGATQTADYVSASPDYFPVMGIPLLRGRAFTADDSAMRPPVAVISETLARRYFPHENPVGRRMTFGFPPDGNVSREIVGVVGDVRDASLSQEPGPMMYVPFAQAPFWGGEVVVKTHASVAAAAGALREQTHAIDKALPVTDIESVADAMGASLTDARFRTILLGVFSTIALLLAAGGIFGVISYSVSRRTNEIGIRMALGAEPGRVLRMILREASLLAGVGVAAGVAGALTIGRFMRILLFGVKAGDPATIAAAASLLVAVALAASWVPARRAAGVEPVRALRHE